MKLNQLAWCFMVAGATGVAPAVHAQVTLVSDTSDNLGGQFVGVGNDMAETFSTGAADGDIGQITLSLILRVRRKRVFFSIPPAARQQVMRRFKLARFQQLTTSGKTVTARIYTTLN